MSSINIGGKNTSDAKQKNKGGKPMKKINLCYITEAGKKSQGQIDREEIINTTNTLIKDYPDNNEIATKLVKALPLTDTLIINKQIRSDDTPVVICIVAGEIVFVKIPAHHKIIWRTLQGYCDSCK